jgi:hypothetical protein
MLPVYGVSRVPAGGELMVRVVVGALMVTVTVPVDVFAGLDESVAFTVMVGEPVVVGVPVMVQFALRVSPVGKVPLTKEQV